MTTYDFCIRIIFCFVLSALIGLERQSRHYTVGLRTNVLVSLGSFMFMCITFGVITSDETRIASQIVSGIGFLGAGVILRDGSKIRGLDTAATLWCVAAIGALTATGMLFEASIGTIFVLISNIILRAISHKINTKVKQDQREKCIIKISLKETSEELVRTTLSKTITNKSLNLTRLEREQPDKNKIKLTATIITSRPVTIEDIVNNLSAIPDVITISWDHQKYIPEDELTQEEDVEE